MAKPTKYAFMLMRALKKLGVRLRAEVPNKNAYLDAEELNRNTYTDIVIPSSKIDIEVDGRQHITDSGEILNDIEKSHNAYGRGYATLHVTNHDVYENVGGVASALSEASAIREEELNRDN